MAYSNYRAEIIPITFDEDQLTDIIKNAPPPGWELISVTAAQDGDNQKLILVLGK